MAITLNEKIAKLFALAGNNPNQNEAISAMAKARELMAENGLTETDIMDPAATTGPVATNYELVRRNGHLPELHVVLSVVIAQAFRCQAYNADVQEKGRKFHVIRIIGLQADVDIVVKTFEFALQAAIRLGWEYAAGFDPRPDDRQMNGYYIGFVDGLRRAFADQQSDHPEWGLVLVKHPAVVEAVAALNLRPAGKIRGTHDGYGRGQQDGYGVGKGNRVVGG